MSAVIPHPRAAELVAHRALRQASQAAWNEGRRRRACCSTGLAKNRTALRSHLGAADQVGSFSFSLEDMMERDEKREKWNAWHRRITVGRVQRGRWRPEQAETWAVQSGQQGFQHESPPEEFEPSKEFWWTPAMVTAWIIWRTYEAVRQHSHAFRNACTDWHRIRNAPVFPNGFDLRNRQPLTASEVLSSLWSDPGAIDQAGVVPGLLVGSLRSGRVKAFGLRAGESVSREIAAHEWLTASPFTTPTRGRPLHDAVYVQQSTEPTFYSVGFKRSEVVKEWGFAPTRPQKKPGPEAVKKQAIEAAMRAYEVDKLAEDERSGTLTVLRLWTMFKQYGGKTQVREVWKNLYSEIRGES